MSIRRRDVIAGLLSCSLILSALVLTASSVALGASDKQPPAPFTVGNLARQIVSEIALDPPAGGYDEDLSIGILTYLGYHGSSASEAPATMGDLQQMLSVVGVQSSTGNPSRVLSRESAARTIGSMRSSLPKISVPSNPAVIERSHTGSPGSDNPSCVAVFQQCRRECLQKSPSGRSGGLLGSCMQECQGARRECARNLGKAPNRRDR